MYLVVMESVNRISVLESYEYKNRVKNDRKMFENPALTSCEQGNLERENSK